MENMQSSIIQMHIWPVIALTFLVALNIVVIVMQKDDIKLKKYLRIQVIAWITLTSMVVFTGVAIMAWLHIPFRIKIIAMIAASIAIVFLELRRHLAMKKARPQQECFKKFRHKALRYYIFELLWLLMVGGLAPQLP